MAAPHTDDVRARKPGGHAAAGTAGAPDPDFVEAAQPPPAGPAGDGGSEGDDPPSQDSGADPNR